MSKELTEKWLNGELPNGEYYIKLDDGSFTTDKYYGEGFGFSEEIPDEVLATVPTYAEFMDLMSNLEYIDKYKQLVSKTDELEKKLEIATKALEEYADVTNWIDGCFMCVYDGTSFADEESAEQALKEMEGVK